MFDLEHHISEWRKAASKDLGSDTIDELESYLRDHIDTLTAQGHPTEPAFKKAVASLGETQSLAKEFNKVGGKSWFPVRIVQALLMAGAITLLIFVPSKAPIDLSRSLRNSARLGLSAA